MDNSLLYPLERLKGTTDQMLSALYQNLYLYVIRDQPALYQSTEEIIFNLGSSRKANLDLLKAQLYQQVEHFHLFFYYHGFY